MRPKWIGLAKRHDFWWILMMPTIQGGGGGGGGGGVGKCLPE